MLVSSSMSGSVRRDTTNVQPHLPARKSLRDDVREWLAFVLPESVGDREFAERIGMSHVTVNSLRAGRSDPKQATIDAIAAELAVPAPRIGLIFEGTDAEAGAAKRLAAEKLREIALALDLTPRPRNLEG